MPRIMRRTPATEEAIGYGYGDLLKGVVGGMLRRNSEQADRMLAGTMTDEDMMDIALGGVGAGTKILRGLGKGKFPFNIKASEIEAWTDVFKRPAAARARGSSARIKFMSPKEYFKRIREGEGNRWPLEDYLEDNVEATVSKYAREMRKGSKFPLLGMEHQGKVYAGQEGRHRALAADRLGIDRIPVLMVKSKGRLGGKDLLLDKFSKEGLRYDAFAEPMPGSPQYNYHQWTLYGEGPAKGATFGTKTTSLEEMEKKITELISNFSR